MKRKIFVSGQMNGKKEKKGPEIVKKPVGEMGYKVNEAEDINSRRDEWEKGKPVSPMSARTNPEGSGYKVETPGVQARLEKWNSLKSGEVPSIRKEPVAIPVTNISKDDQTDVKTVKYT